MHKLQPLALKKIYICTVQCPEGFLITLKIERSSMNYSVGNLYLSIFAHTCMNVKTRLAPKTKDKPDLSHKSDWIPEV